MISYHPTLEAALSTIRTMSAELAEEAARDGYKITVEVRRYRGQITAIEVESPRDTVYFTMARVPFDETREVDCVVYGDDEPLSSTAEAAAFLRAALILCEIECECGATMREDRLLDHRCYVTAGDAAEARRLG